MIVITTEPLQPWQWLAAFEQQQMQQHSGKYGATALFTGTMRDNNLGSEVTALELQHYPGMTETQLQLERTTLMQQHQLQELVIVHRVGMIYPTDTIVLVAAWSAHRQAAFAGCREMMEIVKSRAPFWKKEHLQDGSSRWLSP